MNTYAYTSQEHRPPSQNPGTPRQQTYIDTIDVEYSTFHTAPTYTSPSYHTSQTFIAGEQGNEIRIISNSGETTGRYVEIQGNGREDKLTAMIDSYFIDSPGATDHADGSPQGQWVQQPIHYVAGSSSHMKKGIVPITQDRIDKEKAKRVKQAEAARLRYHRLTNDEKKELNLKRTLAQKRKRQREKELEQLDEILRASNDIQEDPDVTEQLKEKRLRAKWAEAARARYQRMTPEERKVHNNRRRARQMSHALLMARESGELTGDKSKDEEAIKRQIKAMNSKKAEAARLRYHRMSEEEKRSYNQRRTEAFRKRRIEEEMLLAMPIGRINGEALDRAQQIVVRNAKRAEAARLRYQRMTPDQRKNYNQKRYTPKRAKPESVRNNAADHNEYDVLTSLEKDVLRRTQQAQQVILRQQRQQTILAQQQSSQAVQAVPAPQSYVLSQSALPAQSHIMQGSPSAHQNGQHFQVAGPSSHVLLSAKQEQSSQGAQHQNIVHQQQSNYHNPTMTPYGGPL
ncbi:unnamed protein product, partial [Mesorhabditis spiculigera]